MMRPMGYRQITERPLTTRTASSRWPSICQGNGEPTPTKEKPHDLRRHSGNCISRSRLIAPGETMVVATWTNKPMITVHCLDCATRYQIFNEADTPKTAQPQRQQKAARNPPEKRGPTEGTRETRREVPQEAPSSNTKNSAQRPKR